ncbi:MAG: hypothetical protein ACLR56_08140 [Oscillospiraceae bacterium]
MPVTVYTKCEELELFFKR